MTRFRVVFSRHQARPGEQVFVLERDLWDDDGYVCTFRVFTFVRRQLRKLGEWKILDGEQRGPRVTELPETFERLPKSFVSVAQSSASYEAVRDLGPELAEQVLTGLRDVVRQKRDVRKVDGFDRAALRFAEARDALRRAPEILNSRSAATQQQPIDLEVTAQLSGFSAPHQISLSFSADKNISGLRRLMVLVGANGTGKTQLLAALARAISGYERRDAVIIPEAPFPKVIAVAYGAFDRFKRPRIAGSSSYAYCGLRGPDADLVRIELEDAITRTAKSIVGLSAKNRTLWSRALHALRLTVAAPRGSERRVLLSLKRMSAGEQIATMVITDLATKLEPKALVLFDEPETHLHPTLLSGLMRAIRLLLDARDAYAILATHSLLPLQESLADSVVILERFGGRVRTKRPEVESFGASLDEIQREVFGVGLGERNFRDALKRAGQHRSFEQIAAQRSSLGLSLALASLKR